MVASYFCPFENQDIVRLQSLSLTLSVVVLFYSSWESTVILRKTGRVGSIL